MRAYIGLVILRGMKGSSLDNIGRVFSVDDGVPYFCACMSVNRFKFITSHLGFESEQELLNRTQYWEADR